MRSVTLLHADRKQFHNKLSLGMVENRNAKRAKAQAKGQVTRQEKKGKKTGAKKNMGAGAEMHPTEADNDESGSESERYIESEDEE